MVEVNTRIGSQAITRPKTNTPEIDLDELTARFPHGFYSAVKELFNGTLSQEVAIKVDKRKLPPTIRVIDALVSFREEGEIEATVEQIYTRARERAEVKHWWQDTMGPASFYDALHYLTGSDKILPRYHLDYSSHDSAGYPVKKLLYRLAPEKTPEESRG